MRKFTKRSAALVAGAVLAVAGGTAAFAYASGWFKGSADVSASSSAIKVVTTTVKIAGTSPETRLWPGHSVTIPPATVNNENDYPVKINEIKIDKVESDSKSCGVKEADLSFGPVPNNTVIPAGQSPTAVVLGTIKMGQYADPACANQTLKVTATMSGEIAAS
ncbi:hypothetical protein ACGFJ7_04410 [Actinoplanes sp. NPDC048988]|uniref:hypothetical protein n=1 Tax=Actinoplanes sp. NPDC048988 TaxID=3363901 RepID=UPI003714DD51